MTIMNNSLKKTLLAASLAALPLTLNAAGLGRINVLSALGQPLNAEIEVQASPDEISSMSAKMASASVFEQANVAFSPVISLIRVAVEPRGGGAVVKLSSDRPVSEPFVDMVVELNWSAGKLIREYTFLLDPAVSPSKAVSAVATPEVPRAAQAPSASPAPARAAAPASAPARASAPADAYTVQRGDTLSKIANANKPQGVSLEQMLVALLRRNPEAFDGNNMNRLKAGRILSIPDAADASAVPHSEARREVVAQAADFNAYRGRLAETVRTQAPTDTGETQQQSSGRIAPRVTEAPRPGDDARDQVRVSRTEMKGAGEGGGSNQERLRMLEEDLAARDRALQDANDRLAELERNIAELQKLIELKNQGMAAAQASAEQAATPAEPAPAPAPAPVAEPAPAEPSAAPVAETAPAPAEPAPAPAPAEPPPSAAAEPVAPAPAPEPPKAAEPPPPPPPPAPKPSPAPAPVSTSFADELFGNPTLLMGAGAAILALLGGLAVMSRRRKANEAASQLAMGAPSELSMGGGSVFGTSGGQSVDTGSSVIQTDFSQSGMSAIDADEGVDPVAEADVYMAYGRDAQAEEILLDALKADPSRTAVHLKLLEIYAQRNSTAQFEATASELYSRTGGRGDDWARAAEMGRGIDPENPLYSETGVGAAAAAAAAAGITQSIKPTVAKVPEIEPAQASSDEMSALDFGLPSDAGAVPASHSQLKDTWAMPGELSQFGEGATGATDTGGISQSSSSSLDFNLDLGDAPEEPAAEQAPSLELDTAPPTEGGGLQPSAASDDTVELPALDLPGDETDKTVIAPVGEASDEDLVLADASETTLEFDLDFAEDEPQASAPVSPAVADDASESTIAMVAEGEGAPSESESEDMAISLADSALDFDIDALDMPGDEPSPAGEAVDFDAAPLAADASASLDFTTDLSPEPEPEITAPSGSGEAVDTSTIGDEAVDLSATIANPVPDEEMATDLEQSSFDGTLLDFDFDLDKPADDAQMPDMDATALDISSISLDLESQEQDAGDRGPSIAGSAEDLPTAIIPPSDGPVDEAVPVEDVAAEAAEDEPGDPEVDTKLELARAYEEMGDKDGARELLEEVLAEGNGKQQEQARVVMSRL